MSNLFRIWFKLSSFVERIKSASAISESVPTPTASIPALCMASIPLFASSIPIHSPGWIPKFFAQTRKISGNGFAFGTDAASAI